MTAPSIEGTYRLVRRQLPDGTWQYHPDIRGLMTFTREYRNFSVLWRDEAGNYYSECYVARYALTASEYTETSEYLIIDDQIGGNGVSYDLHSRTASATVTSDEEHVAFDLPQQFERQLSIRVEFRGPELIATGKGQFVDYWERVP